MKKILVLLILSSLILSCKSKYSFKTREGKKKLEYYNSVPYRGYPTNPKSKH